jgi:cytidylate kinase
MKKQIITIAGRPGSGKSTTARTIAAKLNFDHFSSGDLFRSIAKEDGMDLLQANISAEKNAEIDRLVDEKLQEMGKTEDKLVIDSRMAWHWMPNSYKVFLDLDLNTAAERIIAGGNERQQVNEDIPSNPSEYAKVLQSRLDSESRRYKILYNVNPYDEHNYDLVVDTAANNIEQVVQQVVEGFKNWQN